MHKNRQEFQHPRKYCLLGGFRKNSEEYAFAELIFQINLHLLSRVEDRWTRTFRGCG